MKRLQIPLGDAQMPTLQATPSTEATQDRAAEHPQVWRIGVAAGIAAAAANTAIAALARTADVKLAIAGEQIPLAGFAQLTFLCALVGIALAAVAARRCRSPRSAFIRTTVGLTTLSMIPVLAVDTTTATRMVLGATHLVGAAIVIATLARRLSQRS